MKRHFWRYSRPVGCGLCLLFLLFLAWFLRWVYGVPPLAAEAATRRVERQYLRPAGEIRQINEEGGVYGSAVTVREGELYTYWLSPANSSGKRKKLLYDGGGPWRDTVRDFSWGCTTPGLSYYDIQNGNAVLQQSFYVLVKQADARVASGRLEILTTYDDGSRTVTHTWVSQAERVYPEYLAFPLVLTAKSESFRKMFETILSGYEQYEETITAEAEAVFYDAEGNEVSRIALNMIRDSANQEGSEENGA